MTQERLLEATHAIVESFNTGDISILDGFYTTECLWHRPPYPDIRGLEAYKAFVQRFLTVFPDSRFIVLEVINSGNTVVARFDWQGTHTGSLPGAGKLSIPPTDKVISSPGCIVFHWRDGRVLEQWDYWDELGFWESLGFQLVSPSF